MNTPIIAVHLTYAQGTFPTHQKWVQGQGLVEIPELLEETLCADCARQIWYLTPEPGDADLRKAAQHLVEVSHLAKRIDLLEQDTLKPVSKCRACHKVLAEEKR